MLDVEPHSVLRGFNFFFFFFFFIFFLFFMSTQKGKRIRTNDLMIRYDPQSTELPLGDSGFESLRYPIFVNFSRFWTFWFHIYIYIYNRRITKKIA
jgi:hypothetical protein